MRLYFLIFTGVALGGLSGASVVPERPLTVEPSPPVSPPVSLAGETLYANYCAACHGMIWAGR